MSTLREKLQDIERYTTEQATTMTAHVRNNYEKVIARKDKEIDELRAELERLRK